MSSLPDPTRRPPTRRGVLAAAAASAGALLAGAAAAPARAAERAPTARGRRKIPRGYRQVDPRTARRIPLTTSLRTGVPIYEGDPQFEYDPDFIDTRTPHHDDGGFLLERITSMGTHTASHISAPIHFLLGEKYLDEIGESFVLMPLVVVDVRARIKAHGPEFEISPADLRRWERRHGRIPRRAAVTMLTGYSKMFLTGSGTTSPYVTTTAPGFSGEAVDWLFDRRGIKGVGSDTLDPGASFDEALAATTRTLVHGGVTLENIGPGLAKMRPYGDWINVNGNRPHMSGFQMGFTGFTL